MRIRIGMKTHIAPYFVLVERVSPLISLLPLATFKNMATFSRHSFQFGWRQQKLLTVPRRKNRLELCDRYLAVSVLISFSSQLKGRFIGVSAMVPRPALDSKSLHFLASLGFNFL